jgi:hypothetical protein
VEHDVVTHACAKCKGAAPCARFDSPWVCNCDHGWAAHRQVTVQRAAVPLAARIGPGAPEAAAAAVAAAAAEEIERWSLVQRGQQAVAAE